MKKISLFLKIVLFLFGFITVERFCHKQTRGFTIQKISSDPAWGTNDCGEEIKATLVQPFRFLASGGQCYAFISEDKKTIIKFFKQHHIRYYQLLKGLPLPAFLESCLPKAPQFLKSCQIASEEFQDRTGLIYLHLHKTDQFSKPLKIIDPLGIVHSIDLDKTEFALQHRAEMPHPKFRALIREGDLTAAKSCIDSMIELISQRCAKGIQDRDPNIRRNFGFLGTKAIEIDLGSFSKGETLRENELFERMKKFHKWLKKENGELAGYLSEQVETLTGNAYE